MKILITKLILGAWLAMLAYAFGNAFYDYSRQPKNSPSFKSPAQLELQRSLDQDALRRLEKTRADYEFQQDAYRRQVSH
jgi:hypothetical protein